MLLNIASERLVVIYSLNKDRQWKFDLDRGNSLDIGIVGQFPQSPQLSAAATKNSELLFCEKNVLFLLIFVGVGVKSGEFMCSDFEGVFQNLS